MRYRVKIFILLLGAMLAAFPGISRAAAGDILAVLFENGSDFTFIPPINPEQIVYPLFCEGQVQPCGEETDFNTTFVELNDKHGRFLTDVKICLGDSCVTTRNALFVGDAVPEIVQPVGVTYSVVMTEHDPIACDDATGIFAEDGCAGNLDLNYRCLNAADPATGLPVKTLAGSFIISKLH